MTSILALRRNVRGATAVEFALILPVLLAVVCGIIEFGYVNFARMNLEAAVTDAARTTGVRLDLTPAEREAAMKTLIQDRMKNFAGGQAGNVVITAQAFTSAAQSAPEDFQDLNNNGVWDGAVGSTPGEPFVDRNGNGQWDAAAPLTNYMGSENDIMRYAVAYDTPLFFSQILGLKKGSISLKATAIGRNELRSKTR